MKSLDDVIKPRRVIKYFDTEALADRIVLSGTDISFYGRDIAAHLNECRRCAVFAVTLGHEADALIRRAGIADISRAVSLDSSANKAVTNLITDTLSEIKSENRFITSIFSPGEGDFSISAQNLILSLLDAYKQCGLTVTRSGVLTPIKSMTGVVGTSQMPVTGILSGCEDCPHKNCGYEKCRRTVKI